MNKQELYTQINKYNAMCHNGFRVREQDFLESKGTIKILDCFIPYKHNSLKSIHIEIAFFANTPVRYDAKNNVGVVINLYERTGTNDKAIIYLSDRLAIQRKTMSALCKYTSKFTRRYVEELLYDYGRKYLDCI